MSLENKLEQATGAIKEGFGRVTGDSKTEAEGAVEKIADRQEAIKAAMAITNHELDAVIIAGKGADCYQIVQGKKEAYQGDAAVAENYL